MKFERFSVESARSIDFAVCAQHTLADVGADFFLSFLGNLQGTRKAIGSR
jgi:hypothetical protein